ncbi:carbon-nitrogen hydrolase family protein [Streptomyces sp. TLI_146]|uniref:carbon-nitrogen hydrolase family protein n=1 Tax=Streptomyces sp. TLI_146 TaxID=1938858 RepID=UPI000C713CED|nr:carbon-nitrogen hydrolase family protein [Streptomyces sp. TLI_146]PKV87616.1 putative amidohydrolase [Streptomyces sp. TLI_146]
MTPFTTPSRPLRIAAAQAPVAPGDIPANVVTVARLIGAAARGGARVVVFAEKFLTGYEPELIRAEPERCAVNGVGDPRLDPVVAACREGGVVAVVGAAVYDGGELFVSALVVDGGGVRARYDKQTLFRAEREVYRHGAAGLTLDVDEWRLGLGICYDSGFPEHARAAALDGCHAYVVGALFGVGGGYHESRIWFPARAFDNTVYAVLANHVGRTGEWETCGGSAVWGPDGRVVAEAGADGEEIVLADLDPAALHAAREAEPMLRDLWERRDTAVLPRRAVRAAATPPGRIG